MTAKPSPLDSAFLARQRERLVALRAELLGAVDAAKTEETDLQDRSVDEAHDLEDDAQKLTLLEDDAQLARRNMDRVRAVERALEKIDDGTYGFSDSDHAPIPRAHLEVVPEATEAPAD